MSKYGSIGITRNTEAKHWKEDYKLNKKTEKIVIELKASRKAISDLFSSFMNADLISDEEYTKFIGIYNKQYDVYLEREDRVRIANN